MSPAVLLAAFLLVPGAPPASIDFGPVELGGAAHRMLQVSALSATAFGAGFSATRTHGGVLIVFEPYELDEQATGKLAVQTRAGFVTIALSGHGIDTIPPRVSIQTPRAAHPGRRLRVHFDAADNDLVRTCTLRVGRHVIGRLAWPVSTYDWLVPAGLRGPLQITVVAVDRAGNHASATTKAFPIR